MMLYLSAIFFVLADFTGFFGFFGYYSAEAGVSRILFWIFLVLTAVTFSGGLYLRRMAHSDPPTRHLHG
jgi:uncharacterized membrane protein YtjA (UPF0391 family)